ncbi:MAG: hypothetical protein ACO29Z_06775, partial [Crocinitomicaceae bacterium]
LPIYRQQDGGNSQEKNQKVFKKATQALARNRNLLVFGEGITDDIFERRLKPIKKGAIRIGFTALETLDWSVEIKVQGLGINYTNPGVLRSDVLISGAEPLVLNDYKEAYLENPSKVITELNRELEARMQAQITHVQSDEDVILHERIMMLTRSGMNVDCYDSNLSLKERWQYSQELAEKLNEGSLAQSSNWEELKASVHAYFLALDRLNLTESALYNYAIDATWRRRNTFQLIAWFPMFFLGLFHIALPYLLVKRFVEKTFKRPVFWTGAKMGMLLVLLPIWNLILLGVASCFIDLHWLVWIGYFVFLNMVAHGFHRFISAFAAQKKSSGLDAQKLNELVIHRAALMKLLKEIGL